MWLIYARVFHALFDFQKVKFYIFYIVITCVIIAIMDQHSICEFYTWSSDHQAQGLDSVILKNPSNSIWVSLGLEGELHSELEVEMDFGWKSNPS